MPAFVFYHWKLYVFFCVFVFTPQILLLIFPQVNIPGMGLAFSGIILMTKLMSSNDKQFLGRARAMALSTLKKTRQSEPRKGEVEVLAKKILESRLFAFYFSGALAIALGLISSMR